jgi:flagellar basal body rod protein FlgG
MDVGIHSAVSGGLAAQMRLDAIANNLANASTPGFKAERFVQAATPADTPGTSEMAVPTPLTGGYFETDLSQGPIHETGNPLDVAIAGEGFLVVSTSFGERLTRRGNLGVDAEGFLSTSDGHRVQGDGGDIQVPPGEILIGPDGGVQVSGALVGKLRVVTVEKPSALVREAGTVFAAGRQALVDVEPENVRLLQGAVEGANVSPVGALMSLIETVRGFEAYMQAAERLDQMTGRAISDVGRV